MNLLISTNDRESQGPTIKSGSCQHPIRDFMDDITVTTAICVDAERVLTSQEHMATMKFKPRKSRSMVIGVV